MDNKFPGKDISIQDLKSKFPLTAKKNKNHFRPRKVLAKTFKSKDITIIQKAPLCKY